MVASGMAAKAKKELHAESEQKLHYLTRHNEHHGSDVFECVRRFLQSFRSDLHEAPVWLRFGSLLDREFYRFHYPTAVLGCESVTGFKAVFNSCMSAASSWRFSGWRCVAAFTTCVLFSR